MLSRYVPLLIAAAIHYGFGGTYWRAANQELQATPVDAPRELLSRRSGVPELDRWTGA